MKKIIILVSVLVMSSLIFAQSASVYDQVGVPTYQAKELYIQGWDLLNFTKTGDNTAMSVNVDAVFDCWQQNADFDLWYGDDLSIDYASSSINDVDLSTTTIHNYLGAQATKYFGLLQAFGGFDFDIHKMSGDVANEDMGKQLALNIGAGVGRVYDATAIAQAIVIIQKLGGEVSDEAVLAVMDIINSRVDYDAKYKDSGMATWLGAIAEAAGGSKDDLTVLKILGAVTMPFGTRQYQISDRMVGWELTAVYMNHFLVGEDDPYYIGEYESKGDILVHGGYGQVLGLDKSVFAYLDYMKTLEEGDWAWFTLGADFYMDHNCTWATNAGFSLDKNMTPDLDPELDLGMEFHVETVKNILRQLYGGAGFSFDKMVGVDVDATIDFNIFFKYFIF